MEVQVTDAAAPIAHPAEAARPTAPDRVLVADYLVERLQDLGVGHVFGVPGDFVLSLFKHLEDGPLTVVNTCDEQGAGFAADAYARINGLGVACVTFGVGGFKVVNTTGQAYAEESPVVVISGAPSRHEREAQPLLHHKAKAFDTQKLVFDQMTVASAVLDDPETACHEIDRVLAAAVAQKRPVYLEIPRDLTLAEAARPTSQPQPHLAVSDQRALAAALDETLRRLRAAERPVAFLGIEVDRFDLLDGAMAVIERANLPTAVTPLDKSAIGEQHHCFLGVYAGKMSQTFVREAVESSDCLLLLGPLLTDVNLGGGTSHIDPERCIHITRDRLRIGYHTYEDVRMADFIAALAAADLPRFAGQTRSAEVGTVPAWEARPESPITVERLFTRLASFLRDETIVIADPGDALFGALDLPVRQTHEFLSSAFYVSLGFAVPASIGAQLAAPGRRPLVLVGDGAFQMTGIELSTSIRYGLSPIVLIFNNGGYVTERLMIDGKFNDILPWDYTQLTALFGSGRSFLVATETDLDHALAESEAATGDVCILDVRLDPLDVSPALRRLTANLGAAARGTEPSD
jgi:TPP-dependent 2-oxoacid decarboxylase